MWFPRTAHRLLTPAASLEMSSVNHIAAIWKSPRATIREILDTNPGKLFLPLAATYGVVHNLHLVMRQEVDPTTGITVLGVLLTNVAFGVLVQRFLTPSDEVESLVGSLVSGREDPSARGREARCRVDPS